MLIGLTGRMGAGKDTVFERIKALLPHEDVVRKAFADPLKDSVCALLGITRRVLDHAKNDPDYYVVAIEGSPAGDVLASMSMRTFLQRYGTEAHRGIFGQDFWLDATLPRSSIYGPLSAGVTIITDCRFQNEAERVRQCGGSVYEVVGPAGPMREDAEHASERPLPAHLLDGYIDNRVRGDNFVWLDRQLSTHLGRYRPSVSGGGS